ncbi:MAG: 30S ribosomal protein S27ae [Candidatus Diapherotrites archaeon]|nr:30S ribosomal protein S27ae [Candidatus Diapherotrites archaeon]
MAEKKGKRKKRQRRRVKKSSFYEVKEGKIVKKRQECPKCGAGVFMAEHKDRYTCGRCGYTKWKK